MTKGLVKTGNSLFGQTACSNKCRATTQSVQLNIRKFCTIRIKYNLLSATHANNNNKKRTRSVCVPEIKNL